MEKVAPIFNKRGYVGASLTDLTNATKMTKGAIYGNFSNKEDLALKAFKYNINIAVYPMFDLIAKQTSSVDKLRSVTSYHRHHYERVAHMGGCPMLRVSNDTRHINPLLFNKAHKLSQVFLSGLVDILEEGKQTQELREDFDAQAYAKVILSMIEGAISLAFTHDDKSFLTIAMDQLDQLINEKLIR